MQLKASRDVNVLYYSENHFNIKSTISLTQLYHVILYTSYLCSFLVNGMIGFSC